MKAKERKLARELRRSGWSVRAIAKQVRCSKSSISKWVR
ncbi:MAG: helix-turn-helix domain-containing protein, partial [Candidatus Omnitrophica bacterium]|nr:helix-turn-helix domain-containing protein [Candidatus Omnitrophota bacterium]